MFFLVKSMSVKQVVNFNLDNLTHEDNDGKVLFQLTVEKNKIIENHSYRPINVQYNKEIEQEILVNEQIIYSYQIPKNFYIYYFTSLNYLFIDAPKDVANNFIKDLTNQYEALYEFNEVNFNFFRISRETNYNAKGAWFSTSEVTVTSKAFYGNEIVSDNEIDQALQENRISFFMFRFDLLNQANTVGISKSGSIVIYNRCDSEELYLELALLAFHEVINL